MRYEQRLVRRDDGCRAGRERPDQLGLGGRDRLERAEQLEMDRAEADDHTDVGFGDLRELGDLAGPAHRHLQHEHLGAGRRRQDLQRQADLGVEVRLARDRAPLRSEHREQEVFRRGLAGRAGDADDPGSELTPPRRGQPLERRERVLGGEDRRPGRAGRRGADLSRERFGVREVGEDAPGAGRHGRGPECAAVNVRPGKPDEQRAGLDGAGVDLRAGRTIAGVERRVQEARAGGVRHSLGIPALHRRESKPVRRRTVGWQSIMPEEIISHTIFFCSAYR